VATRFSPPQRGKNQNGCFYFIFYVRFGSFFLKENNFLRKRRIGLGTESLSYLSKKKKTMFEPRLQRMTRWPVDHVFFSLGDLVAPSCSMLNYKGQFNGH